VKMISRGVEISIAGGVVETEDELELYVPLPHIDLFLVSFFSILPLLHSPSNHPTACDWPYFTSESIFSLYHNTFISGY